MSDNLPVKMPEGWKVGDPVPEGHPWRENWVGPRRMDPVLTHEQRPVNPANMRLNMRLDADTRIRLNDLMEHFGVTQTEIVRLAIEAYWRSHRAPALGARTR